MKCIAGSLSYPLTKAPPKSASRRDPRKHMKCIVDSLNSTKASPKKSIPPMAPAMFNISTVSRNLPQIIKT